MSEPVFEQSAEESETIRTLIEKEPIDRKGFENEDELPPSDISDDTDEGSR